MTRLPPQEILRKNSIAFVANAVGGKYTTTCRECLGGNLRVNSNVGPDFGWCCDDCGWSGPQWTPIEAATILRLRLVAAGYIPLPLYGKTPPVYGKNNPNKGLAGWQDLTAVTPAQIDMWERTWPDAENTGVLTRSMPTLDLDILNEEAARACEDLVRERYEDAGYVLVRIGKPPKRAIPFRTEEPFDKILTSITAAHGVEGEKIEFLANGQQVAVAGIHPDTKQPYRWHGGEPGEIKREELPYIRAAEAQALVDDIIELLVRDFGYTHASGRGGKGGNSGGEGGDDWQSLFDNIRAGRELHKSLRNLAAKMVKAGTDAGAVVNLLRALMESSGAPRDERWQERYDDIPRLVADAEKLVKDEEAQQRPGPQPKEPLFDPWERFVVPAFPLDILSPVLREFVLSQSKVIGGCPAGMAMSTLTAVSAATSHRWSLKMMEHGQWYVHPRLWTLLVGDPSVKKTPEIDAACAPLENLQSEANRNYKEALRHYEENQETGEDGLAAEKPEPPPRYVVMDVTTQKLGEILSRSDRGLLVKRDELTGWIGEMDRYNNATRATSDRAFWLKACDGGPYDFGRISRGEIFIENLSVSIIGGIQPERLAELRGLTTDGLLQRFLPVMMAESSFTLDEPANVNPYWALIRQLAELPPQHLSMTDTARKQITELRNYLHDLEKNSGGIARGFQSFVGKLAGYAGSLAIVLHLSEFPNERFIGGKIAENVCRLTREFLLPHAYEFYAIGESGDQLKRLASYVLTCNKDRVLASDLTANIRDLRGLPLFEVRERVSVLVAGGWLDPVDRTPTGKAWWINPAVKLRFAEQAQKEAERKRAITEMLRARKRTP